MSRFREMAGSKLWKKRRLFVQPAQQANDIYRLRHLTMDVLNDKPETEGP